MRRARALVAMTAAVLVIVAPGTARAQGASDQSSSGYSTGHGVGAEASQVTRSPGAGGGSSSSGRSGPAIDYQARYQSLVGAMAGEQLRETDRRATEAARYHALRGQSAECSSLAAHYRSIAYRRVLVVERVPETRTVTVYEHIPFYETVHIPVTVYEHIPIVEHYSVWVRHGWRWVLQRRTRISWSVRAVTTYRTERRLTWRVEARTVTFTVWHTVERWETRLVNPVALAVATVYANCALHYAALADAHEGQVAARRATWNVAWSGLNREAHEAWRAFNTSCTTGARQGDFATQVCSFGEWRGFAPGSFSRTVRVVPPRPSTHLIQQARDEVGPPPPVIRMNPRVEWEQIVRLPTWMWLEGGAWAVQTARADAGEAWAEARAVPARVTWDMGNGESVTCRDPGSSFDESRPGRSQTTDCSYTYRQSSAGRPADAYTVTATVFYDVTWTGSGGAGGDLGTLTTSSSARVRVAELQALNV